MTTGRRALGVAGVLVALVVIPVIPASPVTAPATAATATATTAETESEADVVDLRGDYVAPARTQRSSTRVRRWPGTTIRYHETIPAKWQWSLDRAIEHWNQAGANMRFKEVASAGRAQVVIKYGETWGNAGLATVGPARNAFVHLSPAYKRADALDATNRIWVGRLFAHELGHTLGFWHTRGGCSLMVAVFNLSTCPLLADGSPGYYHRRWIDAPLLERYIDAYGGSAKRPPKLGLIAPLPPQLTDVEFGGGLPEARPVSTIWRAPDGVPAGSKVEVLRWRDENCDQVPRDRSPVARVDPATGRWSDNEFGEGVWCYQVRIANRYGATRPGFSAALERWTPTPEAPALSEIVWDATQQRYRFSWAAPAGTTLAVRRDWENPENCLTTYDANLADQVYADQNGTYWLDARAARECLTFFAVNEWNSGPPTTRLVEVPAPTETPVVGEVGPPEPDSYGPVVSASLADDRYALGIEVLAGPCPAEVPGDLGWFDGWELEPDRWELIPEGDGLNCALFAAVDESHFSFTLHGPVVMREFSA